jgi:hypothetical protein
MYVWRNRVFFFFVYGYSVFPASLVEKTIISLLSCYGTVIENQLAINVTVYFWTLNSILLICMPISVLVPHCIVYCRLVASFESEKCMGPPTLFLLFKIVWVFYAPWDSICILGSACHFLQRSQLGFWQRLCLLWSELCCPQILMWKP